MSRFINKHKTSLLILLLLILWRIYYIFLESLRYLYPQRTGYLGFVPQGNFDGVFYVAISQFWYRGLDQAFFPFYPIIVWVFANTFSLNPSAAGIIVSIFSLFLLLFVFYKLIKLDTLKKSPFWSLLFFLSFPSAFFLGNIYTESFFILLILLSFYFVRRKHRMLGSIIAGFASGTRVVGIFLLPALIIEFYAQLKEDKKKLKSTDSFRYFAPLLFVPLGLLSYMGFLWYKYADPLLFVHIQPSFGAGRSGGEIILLPQVIFRYVKIFLTVSPSSLTFFMSLLELTVLVLGVLVLYFAYKKGIRKSYILFSFFVLIFPTLSGTLSSMPRYILASFAMFIFLGQLENKVLKVIGITFGFMLQGILAILFFQGYFVS